MGRVRRGCALRGPSDPVGDRRVRVVAVRDPVRAVPALDAVAGARREGAGGAPSRPRARESSPRLGAAVCAVLALLSKEVAASLPVLLLGYDWLLLHSASPAARRRALMVVVPLGLVTALTMVYRVRSLAGTDATVAAAPLLNLLTQSIVIWRYLGLMLWPSGQSIMHSAHTVTTLADPLGLAAAAGLRGARRRRVHPAAAVAAAGDGRVVVVRLHRAVVERHRAARDDGRAPRLRGECRHRDGRHGARRAAARTRRNGRRARADVVQGRLCRWCSRSAWC